MRAAQLRAALLLVALCAGCRDRTPVEHLTGGPGPSLRLVDSVVLEETDSVYLGKPELGFAVDPAGSLYIADEFWNRVVQYAPDGRLERVFGRAGSGPGEFRSTTRATLVFDSLLIQPSATRIKVFDRRTGDYYFEHPFQRGYLTKAQFHQGIFYFASFDYGSERAIMAVPAPELLAPDPGNTPVVHKSELVAFPPEYKTYPGLLTFNSSSMVVWADTMLVGFSGVGYVVRYDLAGNPRDTFDIPVRIRHGVTAEGLAQFNPGNPPDLDKEMRAISDLKEIWRLPNGDFVFWYQDGRAETRGRNVQVFGDAFISVVSKDLTRACVDTRVPFQGTEWPRFGILGDTLLALDQVTTGEDSLRATTIVRRFAIDTVGCLWRPVAKRGSGVR